MDFTELATELLAQWDLCCKIKTRYNSVDLQLLKDQLSPLAHNLHTQLVWGTPNQLAEACYQFEPRLHYYQERVIVELLLHGSY